MARMPVMKGEASAFRLRLQPSLPLPSKKAPGLELPWGASLGTGGVASGDSLGGGVGTGVGEGLGLELGGGSQGP